MEQNSEHVGTHLTFVSQNPTPSSQTKKRRAEGTPFEEETYKVKNVPYVGAFTAQCKKCSKWRLLPSKEIFEAIRANILKKPFECEAAREWRPEISCESEADITQDGQRLWAIDGFNIPRTPPGWERIVNFRGVVGPKFADVYYVTPSGMRLRSEIEVLSYLLDNPKVAKVVSRTQFSFQYPKPLQKDTLATFLPSVVRGPGPSQMPQDSVE